MAERNKKYILVDFPDGFEPPDKFDGVEDYRATGECEKCPIKEYFE